MLQIVDVMGKGLKRSRIQELEEINQCVQAKNAKLRRILDIIEDEKRKLDAKVIAQLSFQ